MQVLSGSVEKPASKCTPFDQAKDNAMYFIMNMSTCVAYETLAQRISLLDTMLSLPILSSSNHADVHPRGFIGSTKELYQNEMTEIETVIKIYCTLPGTPEA